MVETCMGVRNLLYEKKDNENKVFFYVFHYLADVSFVNPSDRIFGD